MSMTNTDGAVAEIGPVYTLLWAGTDSVASIVKAHRLKVGDKLIPADSLAGLRAELEEANATIKRMTISGLVHSERALAAESTLAAVGALADELATHPAGGEAGVIYANRIKTLIAEAGTSGVGDG